MNPVHIQNPLALERRNRRAAGEDHLIRRINPFREIAEDRLHAILRRGFLQRMHHPLCLRHAHAALHAGIQKRIAVAHAVQIQQEAPRRLRMRLHERLRTEKALFLIVKQDIRDIRPVLHAPHRQQHEQHAGGVVVRRVAIGRPGEHQKQRKRRTGKAGRPRKQTRRQRMQPRSHQRMRAPARQHTAQYDRQRKDRLLKNKQRQAARRREIRQQHRGAGIIMRSDDRARVVGVAEDDVARADKPPALLHRNRHAMLTGIDTRPFDKRVLLPAGLADLIPAQQNILYSLLHAPPSFISSSGGSPHPLRIR